MHRIYGINLIDLQRDSLFKLLWKEITAAYSIFQIITFIIWWADDYALFAFILLGTMMTTLFTTIYENYSQGKRMRSMTFINIPTKVIVQPLNILDNNFQSGTIPSKSQNHMDIEIELQDKKDKLESVEIIESMQLAVGDVVYVKQGEICTTDLLLIKGKTLVNEAMLTGESLPITKRMYQSTEPFNEVNIIYAGTECIMSTNAIGLVLNTGLYTRKGEIIRNLLFTEHEEFQFKRDAIKLLVLIFVIVLISFIWLLVYIKTTIYSQFYTSQVAILRGLEMFTVAIPPFLPFSLTVGLGIASKRLKARNVFTLFLDKINQAGRVKLCCFNKTGTLTENSLKLKGLLPVYYSTLHDEENLDDSKNSKKDAVFSAFYDNLSQFADANPIRHDNNNYIIYECFACSQSLQKVDEQLVGDPIEVQLFVESGFSLSSQISEAGEEHISILPNYEFINKMGSNQGHSYLVEKVFDFTSERKRMSVIVSSDNKRKLFLKGAPELCKNLRLENTMPKNFDEVLAEFTSQGFRVLALAYKEVLQNIPIDNIAEDNLNFVGLVIFENPLKPESKETLHTLQKCGIKSNIITGDNLVTALSVGISLSLFDFNLRVFAGDVVNGDLIWEEFENEAHRIAKGVSLINKETSLSRNSHNFSRLSSKNSLYNHNPSQKSMLDLIIMECKSNNCVICLTGAAFDELFNSADLSKKAYQVILLNTFIFARTNPSQKASIVRKYQEYYKLVHKEPWFVCFCGDGANDTEALKKAEIGLSLTSSEALLAATFNSTRNNISCLIDLLIHSKASLEISLQNAKYVIYCAIIKFVDILLIYTKGLEFSNFHYIYWDLFSFVPLSIFVTHTEAVAQLNKHYPATTLLSKKIVISLFGQITITTLFIVAIHSLVYSDSNSLELYEISSLMPEDKSGNFYRETEAMFFHTGLMVVWGTLIFIKGFPFMKPAWTNFMLISWVSLCTILLIMIYFSRYAIESFSIQYLIADLFRILPGEQGFVYLYAQICIISVAVSYVFEKIGVRFLMNITKKHL